MNKCSALERLADDGMCEEMVMVSVIAIESKERSGQLLQAGRWPERFSAVALHRNVRQSEKVHCNPWVEGCQAERHGLTMRVPETMIVCLEFRDFLTELIKQETI
ncbi:MAG: hypothetical protein P4K94_00315 [Terracidiphilus sp.]|nr:hypothetical protein [Terracidiphilus sp.]